MKKMLLLSIGLLAGLGQTSYAQGDQAATETAAYGKELSEEVKKNWFNLSYAQDKVYGTGTDITYKELIKDKKASKKIVVAVIDSGVDWEHQDLQEQIWLNADEVPNNGKDDDNNGYIDDVHGWNFLVDDNGNDINGETMEATRVLQLSRKLKEEGKSDEAPNWMTPEIVEKSIAIYNQNIEDIGGYKDFAVAFDYVDSVMMATFEEDYSFDDAATIEEGKSQDLDLSKKMLLSMQNAGVTLGELKELRDHVMDMTSYHLNLNLVTRTSLTPEDKYYGNNHYEGESATHGTHVAGIIAANRSNDFGANGIASEVAQIMILRAVPNGDEHDVDIANSIRYAVDNGANIINMSFGKGISPHYDAVTEALEYANENNVLVVHAAGNDNSNNDTTINYPNNKKMKDAENASYLTVGAITPNTNKKLLAPFTNYGEESIDIYAPGYDIYSTVPDDEYKYLNGTSMAAPAVSGAAALIWAYHPELTAKELKQVLVGSSKKLASKKVVLPGTKKEKVKLESISANPGLLDVFAAFNQLAVQ